MCKITFSTDIGSRSEEEENEDSSGSGWRKIIEVPHPPAKLKGKRRIIWKQITQRREPLPVPVFESAEQSEDKVLLTHLQYFKKFLSDDFFKNIVEQCNVCSAEKFK